MEKDTTIDFSPTPWQVTWDYEKPYKVYASNGMLIATLPSRTGCQCFQDKGNLSLVRHSPEMYALLKVLLKMNSDGCKHRMPDGSCCGGCTWCRVRELVKAVEYTKLMQEERA